MSKIKSCFAVIVCLFLFTGSASLFSESVSQVVRQHIKAMKERDEIRLVHSEQSMT